MHGNTAFQQEKMRRLEELVAAGRAGRNPTRESSI
jgi:hypothetical protein